MSNFQEFTALCKEEKSKEEIHLEKTINGEVEDLYLPGFEKFRIMVDMSSIISFNEGDSHAKNDCTVVALSDGNRYKIDLNYDDFKEIIKEFYQ